MLLEEVESNESIRLLHVADSSVQTTVLVVRIEENEFLYHSL
jgi:hypothetical protein